MVEKRQPGYDPITTYTRVQYATLKLTYTMLCYNEFMSLLEDIKNTRFV
jgi:hypothetical protein